MTETQRERTALAWARTLLLFLGTAAVLTRLLASSSPALAMSLVGVVVIGVVAALATSRRRYRLTAGVLRHGYVPHGGVLPLAVTMGAVVTGVLALVALVAVGV